MGVGYGDIDAVSVGVNHYTWLKNVTCKGRPMESEPLVIGSGEKSTQLMPHPVESDPEGSCSRFYGQADWVRGGGSRHGWMHRSGHAEHRGEFTWQRCWQAGEAHGHIWTEMGEHRRMGPGHGPGHHGGRGEQ